MYKNRAIVHVLLVVCVGALMACKANPREILSRKWKPVDASGPNISPGIKKEILKEGNMMEFTANGKFISYVAGDQPQTGSYNINEKATLLTVQNGPDMQTTMKVMELNRRKLVLETNGVVLILEPVK